MTPTADLLLMFFQTADARRQSVWTIRQLSAAVDKCERSVKTAARQLADAGEVKLTESGAVLLPFQPTPAPEPDWMTVTSEIVTFEPDVEPVDRQLNLFDADVVAPAPVHVPDTNVGRSVQVEPVQAAACRVTGNREQGTEKTTPYSLLPTPSPCTNDVQGLNKPCTSLVQNENLDRLQAAMARLATTFDSKRATPAREPMKQENNINKSMNYESSMEETYDGATTEKLLTPHSSLLTRKRDLSLYNYYLSDVKRRFPGWIKPLFNPATKKTGNCKWAVETLANIMAYGAPECVYSETVDYCFGRNSSVKNPAAAFLSIVAGLKNQYQWRENVGC